jgi:hypothetical protein
MPILTFPMMVIRTIIDYYYHYFGYNDADDGVAPAAFSLAVD